MIVLQCKSFDVTTPLNIAVKNHFIIDLCNYFNNYHFSYIYIYIIEYNFDVFADFIQYFYDLALL